LIPKRLALLVAQPPDVDPRIDWTASTAADEFDVTVVALSQPQGSARRFPGSDRYRTIQVPRRPGLRSNLTFAHAVLLAMPLRMLLLGILLGVGSSLLLIVFPLFWALYQLARRNRILRAMTRRLRTAIDWHPLVLTARPRVFLATVAMHFAPVARAFEAELDSMDHHPDIVHCCDLDTLLIGVRAKERFGCRLVYDAHEFWPESDPDAAAWERWLYSTYERILIRYADQVITVNPPLARHFEREYGIGPVISVPNAAPWAASEDYAHPPSGDGSWAAPGKVKFLFQGGFAPMRGIVELLHAWHTLMPTDAVLLLRGPDNDHKEQCRNLAAELGLLGHSVFFPAPVDTKDLVAAARDADIGVIPYLPGLLNHRLCCPNKLSQYMHAGLMIVCSDLEYVRDTVTAAQAGISYDSAQKENLVAALRRALDDTALRSRCRRNALAYAQSTFNWQTVSAPLMAAYREIAQKPSGRKPYNGLWGCARQRTVLVLYYTRGIYPLRNTIWAHMNCWRRYSRYRTVYVNVAFGFPASLIRQLDIDAVVFDTTFLSMRWSPSIFQRFTTKCRPLIALDCIKIVLPQDEFLNTRILEKFIAEFGVTHVLTCADETDWPTIYADVDRANVTFRTVLTGYIDPDTRDRIEAKLARNRPREVDIGYRAWRAEYWLGEHATHKVRVAEVVGAAADAAGLRTDISLREQDVIGGDAWFDFLLRCRATIGVEGGATVLDTDGEVKRRVDAFLQSHPGASFAATRDACFPGEDGRINLMCLSPRHLEACATRTCQLLVEGRYNGILLPWRHYVPIARDYSNVQPALALLADPQLTAEIVERAYQEIACNEALTYRAFVRDVEQTIIGACPQGAAFSAPWKRALSRLQINAADRFNWAFIRFERWFLGRNDASRRQMVRALYKLLLKRQGAF
jgi:glycosyltransferase involved in cell wall biosynthesis